MHKKRIKDKDYFYTSIRDENGKVKTIYLGSDKKNAKLKERELGLSKSSAGINLPKFSIVLIILAVFLTGFFTTTGLDILNITEDSNEEIILGEQIQEKEEKQNKKSEKNETDIEVVELTNESISEKKVKKIIQNETTYNITKGNQSPSNESQSNISQKIIQNQSETRNDTINFTAGEIIINESESNTTSNETNITTPEINDSIQGGQSSQDSNEQIIQINETESNATINVSENLDSNETLITNQTNITQTEETTQYAAVINQPVKWKKRVLFTSSSNETLIKIPKDATNISINEIINGEKIEINEDQIIFENENSKGLLAITGAFIINNDQYSFFNNFLGNIFKWTGLAVYDDELIEEEQEITITEEIEELEIEYETLGPIATETITNDYEKQVVISSEIHYENILAYTTITNSQIDSINLYWIVNGTKEKSNFTGYDSDGDELIDYIEWIVPHLSNQTYEIIIITKAVHLDENKDIISDVYDFVKAQDDNYTLVPTGNYLRVTFEQELDSSKDITIYSKSNGTGGIEVYGQDDNESLATFSNISSEGEYKIYLTNLIGNQDTFDLKILDSDIEFDYVVDPVYNSGNSLTAYEKGASLMPSNPFDYDSEATSSDYTAISTSNNARWITQLVSSNNNYYNSQIFLFNISETPAMVDNLTISWEGYGDLTSGYNTYMKIWNWTSDTWYQLGVQDFSGFGQDLTLTESIISGTTDFINSSTNEVAVLMSSKHHYSAPRCFVANTKIIMSDESEKNIEDVQIGDTVKSWDQQTSEIVSSTVTKLSQPIHDDMISIMFEHAENINTFDHPYWVVGKGWASHRPDLTNEKYDIGEIKQLNIGDVCLWKEGDKLIESKILDIDAMPGDVQTYIFELDNAHTFFANGILTHNKKSLYTDYIELDVAATQSRLYLPTDEITAAYIANGTASGEMPDGSTYDADEFIHFEHNNRGKRFKLKGLFSGNTVDLRNLIIRANDYQTVIDARNIQGVESTHTIYIPNSINSGAYICPNAYTLEDISSSCSGKITFSYAEANSGTWKSGIFAEIEGSNYKISNLTGSGGSEYTPSCGDSITVNTTLAAGLTDCAVHGLSIGAHNIVLDCQGHTIDGDISSSDRGISLNNYNNVVVKNCVITEFDYGMLSWWDATNQHIYNNTIYNITARGILISDSNAYGVDNNIIENNTIYDIASYGIFLNDVDGTIVHNNTIYDSSFGIFYDTDAANTIISNNTIYDNTGDGIHLRGNDNNVTGNKIYNNSDEGIHIYNVDAYNNIISSNEVYENYDYNIYISNGASSNIVKDNNIHSSDSDGGIYVAHTTTTNNQIINNTVHDNIDEGIAIGIWSTLAGNNNSVINNTIFSNGLRGIFVNTDNTTVHGNNVYGNSNYGIYIYKVAGHVNVTNNYVYNGLNRGIESQESQNISVTNNYVFNNSLHGFFLYKTNNSLFRNNTLTDNFKSSYGGNVELFVFSFNIFEDNKIIGGSDFGLRTYINVNNNIIRNNLVANSSDDLLKFGDSSSGDCDNNTFINNTFESNGSFNFLATINYANNNEFIDNTFTGSGTHFYFGNDGNNTIFLNTTFDSLSWEVAGVHDVYVKWYLDIKVNTSDGDLENANVTLYNNTDVLEFSELTNASGWILRKNLTEYMYDGSTYTYYTNYTVNTTSPSESYGNNSREIDLTSSIVEYITLDSLNEAPIVSSAKITPTIAHTADNLAGYCNATDANLDNVTYYYEWYNDGILNNSGDSVLCASGHTNNGDGTCTVTLRPDSGGDLTEFPNVVPSGAHYLNVDESVADNDTTFVGSTVDVSGTPTLKVALKENSVISVSPNVDLFATYYIDSWTKTTRPSDSGQWTIADIDALQIGVNATTSLGASDVDLFNLPTSNIPANSIVNSVKIYERSRLNVRTTTNIRVTQVYVNVTYTPSIYYLPGVEINVNNLSNSLTTKGENWTFNCMAFDGIINASSWVNESIIIQNSLPEQVLLDLPENGNNTIDRTPGLSWNVPDDDDSDSLTYHLFVNDSAGGIIYNQTGVATNSYTFSSDLTLDDTYSWRVRANDSEGFGSWSSLWNFTVDSVVTISATTNSIAFGSLGPGVTSNTSTDSPPPFVLQNDGNSLINISVNASQLFDQAALGTDAYQFKVDNTTETGSFSWLTSIINWFNMPSGAVVAIDSLKYEDSTDSVEVDILATVPTDELAGSKSSTVYFEAAIAE